MRNRLLVSLFFAIFLTGCAAAPAAIPPSGATQSATASPQTVLTRAPSQAAASPTAAAPQATLPAPSAAPGTPVTQPNQPLAVPPAAKLQIGDQEQTGEIGTYCWQPPALKGRTFEATCADAPGVPSPLDPLSVHSPFTATFVLPGNKAPSEVSLFTTRITSADALTGMPQGKRWWQMPSGQPTSLDSSASPSTQLTLAPGEYLLTLTVRWTPQGDATYGFLVQVQ